LKPPPLLLQLVHKTLCLLQLPEGDQGFNRVAVETEECRLSEARLGDVLGQGSEEAVGVSEPPERELEKAADRPQIEVRGDDAHAQRKRHPFVGGRPGHLDPAEVCSNESSDRERERTLAFLAALGRGLVRLLGVTTRHLEVAAQHLAARQVEEQSRERMLVAALGRVPMQLLQRRQRSVELTAPLEEERVNPAGADEDRLPLGRAVELEGRLDARERSAAAGHGLVEGHVGKRASQHARLAKSLRHLERRASVDVGVSQVADLVKAPRQTSLNLDALSEVGARLLQCCPERLGP